MNIAQTILFYANLSGKSDTDNVVQAAKGHNPVVSVEDENNHVYYTFKDGSFLMFHAYQPVKAYCCQD